MNIKKSDIISLAREVHTSQNDTGRFEKAPTPAKAQANQAEKSLNVDALRSQVMGIQSDVKQLQTQISFRQVQIAFLDELKENSNWKTELQRFMQERFDKSQMANVETNNLTEFTEQTKQSISSLNNNLLKKEIQLQNIFSSGLVSDNQIQISLFKDISDNSELFAKLKPESVEALLKQD